MRIISSRLFQIILGSGSLAVALALGLGSCLPLPGNNETASPGGAKATIANPSEEQRQARNLFHDVLGHIQDNYADETSNHQTLAKWKKHYEPQIKTFEDAYVAIDSVIGSLNDPYTSFFRPDAFREQNMALSSRLFGVGVEIAMIDERVRITNVLPDSPAMETGRLELGDTLTHINGVTVEGLSLMDVAKQIRGKKGTSVHLTLMPEKGQQKRVSITRDEINLQHVQVVELNNHPDTGYIKLQSFMGEGIDEEFKKALLPLAPRPYLVIDLRNNGGGMLSNAVAIADMFLNQGGIVEVDGRDKRLDTTLNADNTVLYRGKIALLMNSGSASASEVLAGALRDHQKAILVGQKSFGKGMVQQVIPLVEYDSGLNITVAHYLTPKGQNLNKVGLNPDIVVKDAPAKTPEDDAVLKAAIKALKKF
jgi:carboxyl-terminal processing protease